MKNISTIIDEKIDNLASLSIEDSTNIINTDVLLAKAFRGKWNEVNAYLEVERSPGVCGTSYQFIFGGKIIINKPGDYDFGLVVLTYIFVKYSQFLTTKAKNNLRKLFNHKGTNLLPESWGLLTAIPESENHVISTNVSLYIINESLYKETRNFIYNNEENGVHEWMKKTLKRLYATGSYEYNSRPYTIFLVKALLTLYTCAQNSEIKLLSKKVLDRMFFKYSLQSSRGLCLIPYRRRSDHLTDIIRKHDEFATWYLAYTSVIPENEIFSYDEMLYDTSFIIFIRSASDYVPPDYAFHLLQDETKTVWSICTHTNMELTYQESNFALFSGGYEDNMLPFKIPFYEIQNDASVRETCLLLHDGSQKISDLIRFIPVGGLWRVKNSTGVYKNFACGTNLTVPVNFTQKISENGFSFIETEDCYIALRSINILWDPFALKNIACLEIVSKEEFSDIQAFIDCVLYLNKNTKLRRFGTSTYNSTRGYEISFVILTSSQEWLIREVKKNGKIIKSKEISNKQRKYLYAEDGQERPIEE